MKIVYLADVENPLLPDKDIYYSLKKMGDVKVFDVNKMEMKKIVVEAAKCDLFLFHGQIGDIDAGTQYLVLERLRIILGSCKGKKVLWFFEKIWRNKINIMLELYNSVDYIFVNDETWLKRFDTDKVFPLHPAAPEKSIKGKFNKEIACDIALVGNVYGQREKEVEFMKSKFGGRVKIFNNKFGRDLADLCKSAKVILPFRFPFDDFYWSNLFYSVMAYGGLVFYPRTQGLKDEGFIDGEHYFDYNAEQELYATLRMLLNKKSKKLRRQITKASSEFVKSNHTYKQRLDKIFKLIDNEN